MALNFPNSPTANQIHTENGKSWIWDTVAWRALSETLSDGAYKTMPQGRLTLTSATPVLSSDVTDTGRIFYTPYVGDKLPIYSGSLWSMTTFTELTLDLHTTQHVIDKNFDLFVVNHLGTLRLVTTVAWTNGTTRATGITMTNGIWLNTSTVDMYYGTGGNPATGTATISSVTALTATYVGTIRTTATPAKTKMIMFPTPGANENGQKSSMFVWNAYNRVPITTISRNTVDTWTYVTAAWRAQNGAGTNSGVDNSNHWICGLTGDQFRCVNVAIHQSTTVGRLMGIGFNSSTTLATGGLSHYTALNNANGQTCESYLTNFSILGLQYTQAIEYSDGATTTFWGDVGSANIQSGIFTTVMM